MSKRVDNSPEARIEQGRQLAMDSVLQDAVRGMPEAGTVDGEATAAGSRRLLWVVAGVAASIFGVWALLWSTGALRSNDRDATESAGVPPDPATTIRPEDLRGGGETEAKPAPKPAPPADEVLRESPQSTAGRQRGSRFGAKPDIPEPNDEGKIDIPAGADPADIRAIRSAQAMLAAEKKLAEMIKAGKIEGADKFLPFDEIAAWRYEDGLKGIPESVKELDGQKVMMTGFMLPIDEVENIKQFLLVQSLWSCCYGTPPDINGTVRVVLTGAKRIDYMFEPIKMVGTFRVSPTIEEGFCVDIFQLETESVETIK